MGTPDFAAVTSDSECWSHLKFTDTPKGDFLSRLDDGGAEVTEALWSKELAVPSKDGPVYQARLLGFLVANLLLGPSLPFPLPSNLREPLSGVFQHHVSGTGFPEIRDARKKPWWRFW